MSRAGLLAAVASAALILPASSLAATVAVEELPGNPPGSTDPNQSKLAFVAAAGEANRLTVSVAGEEDDFLGLRLVDTAAAIQPGPGCGGGGAAGTPVLCRVHKPTVGDSYICFKMCYGAPGTAWDLKLRFALGDGGSRLDTTALPAGIPNHEEFSPSASVEVTVLSGAGDDTILAGPEPDVIDSSPGADLVRTGDGSDVFHGGPVPDGPDDVEFGNAVEDVIDYSDRTAGISYEPNGRADDGAAGEGDNLGAAGYVFGGARGDTLAGAPGKVLTYGAEITGGGGDDTSPVPRKATASPAARATTS